jgi:hypothetical protein
MTGIGGLIAVQAGGTIYRMRLNSYQERFVPAMEFLRHKASSTAMIMGSAEMGFGLGFERNLVDDIQLGAVSGKTPDFIVVEESYETIFKNFVTERPEIYKFINNRLTHEFEPVYKHSAYTIYGRRNAAP